MKIHFDEPSISLIPLTLSNRFFDQIRIARGNDATESDSLVNIVIALNNKKKINKTLVARSLFGSTGNLQFTNCFDMKRIYLNCTWLV